MLKLFLISSFLGALSNLIQAPWNFFFLIFLIFPILHLILDSKIKDQLNKMEKDGFGKFPICIAKTQFSFSTNPDLKGAPSDHEFPIREVRLSSGAEYIVVICGSIMTMPGLPSVPAADSIKLNDKGEIEGLF